MSGIEYTPGLVAVSAVVVPASISIKLTFNEYDESEAVTWRNL